MYYSHTCTHCGKIFYSFNDDKELAAEAIYAGIEQHMKDYGESEDASYYHEEGLDTKRIYSELTESSEAPSGGYQV